MKITLIQPDLKWEDKKANLKHLGKFFGKIPDGTNLVVLPEMFNTGFSLNTDLLAEAPLSDTYSWMKEISRRYNIGICGSFIVKEQASYFNRFIFISTENENIQYDKRHLFSIGGEDTNFTKGTKRVIFNSDGFRINPLICYDLRFPVWTRNRNDFDLILCVANWPESRREIWKTLLKARAIENQCYVAGVNRVGSDMIGNSYAGDSVIIDPKGNTISSISEYEEGLVNAELSLPELREFRSTFPVWKDADDFQII